ncbi:S41 family peptidase [Reichenbachiella agarivorans]|uniref:S41 family peptidase n=1 Tax=Reichenbachiella agarivorans TaxID=2979464 RepID=A0ABY6CMI2_9BACT|nr:S41 family peptidase [Reichenbachiella agarivorans]UXP31730.1 S41 family peptidase [Reichenbachiella agarivorans]
MNRKIVILSMVLGLSSCEELFFEDEVSSTSPQTNLDYLWNEVDKKYSFFEVKNIDWEEEKTRHEAMIYEGMSDDSLFQVLGSMMTELRDDHTNLISSFNVSFFGVRFNAQDNFDFRIIQDNYLPRDYYISGPFTHDFIANNQIGYIRFPSFTGTINFTNLGFILDRYKDTEGLIFDLRENGGGAVSDVFALLSRLIDEETLIYQSRIRNGKEHSDFSELESAYLEPYPGTRYTHRPVVFLIDRGTYSAGSFTSLATKAIPNITLIGDTTGGGLGLPNGGQLPNGWRYRFSITQAFTNEQASKLEAGLESEVNADNYENGVPPDIYAIMDWTNMDTDEVLERAIDEILK